LSWWGTPGGRKKEKERIDALEKRLERLESGFRTIRMEWEDVYDRLMKVMGRLNARIRKSEGVEAPQGDTQPTSDGLAPPFAVTGSHAVLTAARASRKVR